MHRCLLIEELLQIICTGVGIYPRRDLLAVALVCHDFFDAAMNHLWRSLPNLFPVLRCLPPNIWRVPLGNTDAALARAITPADLKRFQIYYAHRVQVLEDWPTIPADISQALSLALCGQPIFPHLVELNQSWNFQEDIDMFLGPRIQKITLRLSGDPAQTSLLSVLSKKYPTLLQFRLKVAYGPDIGRQMNHILPGWTQLQSLTVPHLPEESLQVVAGLPHLLCLVLSQVDSELGGTFSPTSNPVFPVLRELTVTAETVLPGINLLRAATNSPLKKFQFMRRYAHGAFTLDWHDLCSTLAGLCNKVALTTICFEDSAVSEGQIPPGGTDQLRPLLSLTNLTYVELFATHGFDFDDAFVRDMATAWPRLQSLYIGASEMRQPIGQRRLTLQGLAPLAEFCPDLQTLSVYVDATHTCFHHINLGSSPSNSCIDRIEVDCSPISQSSVPWAAAYLSMVFPKLRVIGWFDPDDDDNDDDNDDDEERRAYPKRWSEVMNHLAAYRHMRGHHQDNLFCDTCDTWD